MYGDPQFEIPAPLIEEPQPVRQPHLGYALLFVVFYVIAPVIVVAALAALKLATHTITQDALKHPSDLKDLVVLGSLFGALLSLLTAWLIFQLAWHRPFWQVLDWNWSTASSRAGKLLLFGLAVSIAAQSIERLMTLPNNMPIESFFQARALLWWLTLYGTIVAPLTEETLFRGLLLPAIARAIDWLRRRPVPPELEWHNGISKSSLGISALLTSVAFGMVHAAQLGHAWNAVALLSGVGLVLAYVRIRFNSLAASTMVHAAYNGSLFLAMFIATGGYRHLDVLTKK